MVSNVLYIWKLCCVKQKFFRRYETRQKISTEIFENLNVTYPIYDKAKLLNNVYKSWNFLYFPVFKKNTRFFRNYYFFSYYANFVKNYLYYRYQAFNFINSLAIDVLELSNTSNLNGIYFLPQCQLFAVIQTL